LLVSCTNDYDPFRDLSKARAVVTHKSFRDNDTLNIFTTETLMVNVADRDLVDSFSVVAPANRRSPDTFVVKAVRPQPFSTGPYTCLVSFTDTGWNTVTVNTYRNNGDRVPQDFSLYLRSPLHQNQISGRYGDSMTLATTPVTDADVMYHWDFGGGYVVSSPLSRTTASVKMLSYSNAGSLWVSDVSGTHPSPRTPFVYYLIDTAGPLIECVSVGDTGKDTIITGDTTFYFKVKIWDPAQAMPVQSAAMDGQKFDIVADPIYIRVFSRMDTVATLKAMTVTAVNNSQFLVSARKTFWFKFSNTMSHGRAVLLTVNDPATDTSVCSSRTKGILGDVEDYASDSISVIVKMQLNDSQLVLADTVHGKYTAKWSFNFPLPTGSNRVRLTAYGANGDSLDGKSLLIVCDPTMKDTVPPVILDVTVNGATARLNYINYDTGASAALRIIAYDEGSGIDSMFVNGRQPVPSPDGHGFIWMDTVSVPHRVGGTAFSIVAVDNSKNRDSVSLILCRNTAPEILLKPPDTTISLGAAYSGKIAWTDPDVDPVQVEKLEGPAALTLGKDGLISWTPKLATDTGSKKVTIGLDDGFQVTSYSFQIYVSQNVNLPPPVQIDTAAMRIPVFYEAGKDSVMLAIKTLNDSGNAPLAFAVRLNSAQLPVNGRLCVWHPALSDTGKQTFYVAVTDTFHRTASAFFPVTVVPPNRPCTLLVRYTIPVTPQGELDLSTATVPDTLFFSVKDPDLPAVERHTVIVQWAAGQTEIAVDSTGIFTLILAPKPANGQTKDTILVAVTDRAGHADSLRFFVTYVSQTSAAFTGKIYINTRSSSASITSLLYGFPLLVRIDTSFFTKANFASAAAGGRDVRFANAHGVPLPYQIERWDNAADVAEIWVKVDTVLPLNDSQYIVMKWGSGSAIDSSNGRAVFDQSSGYVGVWHMNDGSAAQNVNAVQTPYAATPAGPGANPALRPGAGVVANADSLTNYNYLTIGQLPTMQTVSMCAWVNRNVRSPFSKIICQPWNDGGGPYQVYSLEITGPSDTAIQFHVGLSNQYSGYAVSSDSLRVKTWTLVAGTYDGQSIRLYVNGALAGSYTWSLRYPPTVPNPQTPWSIGGWGQQTNECVTGKIDEVRIYSGVWSPDYIKLSYENQRTGSAVLQFR
jgi:hypothetical protein